MIRSRSCFLLVFFLMYYRFYIVSQSEDMRRAAAHLSIMRLSFFQPYSAFLEQAGFEENYYGVRSEPTTCVLNVLEKKLCPQFSKVTS